MSFVRNRKLAADEEWSGDFVKALRDLAPFAITAAFAWAIAVIGNHIDWPEYGISILILAVAWAVGTVLSLQGQVRAGTVLAAVIFMGAIGVLRDSAGGSTSGVGLVSLLAVLQTALYVRQRGGLAIVVAALGALYLVPLVVVGGSAYPSSGYRAAILAIVISAVLGLVTQSLVADIRSRALELRRNVRMIASVNETVQRLFDSDDARTDLCRAMMEISKATSAFLYEASLERDILRCSASTVDDPAGAVGAPASPPSGLYDAYWSGKQVLVTEDAETQVGNYAGWVAAGRPESVLYQPLLRGDRSIAVMVVTWNDLRSLDDPRAASASLLAHEGAAVISRADVIEHLTDEAYTDPLTGLPNRRAWDARLSLAIAEGDPLAVVMLDIDHFKQFNDTHGHPAGDRLLRESSAAWRSVTRTGDFMARLGGEEFGMLIFSSDRGITERVVNRVREQITDGQTCSAGVAFRLAGEPADVVLERADKALYDAKSSGRDRTCFSDAGQSDQLAPRADVGSFAG